MSLKRIQSELESDPEALVAKLHKIKDKMLSLDRPIVGSVSADVLKLPVGTDVLFRDFFQPFGTVNITEEELSRPWSVSMQAEYRSATFKEIDFSHR